VYDNNKNKHNIDVKNVPGKITKRLKNVKNVAEIKKTFKNVK